MTFKSGGEREEVLHPKKRNLGCCLRKREKSPLGGDGKIGLKKGIRREGGRALGGENGGRY